MLICMRPQWCYERWNQNSFLCKDQLISEYLLETSNTTGWSEESQCKNTEYQPYVLKDTRGSRDCIPVTGGGKGKDPNTY